MLGSILDYVQHAMYTGFPNIVALWQIGYFSTGVHNSEHLMNVLSRIPKG